MSSWLLTQQPVLIVEKQLVFLPKFLWFCRNFLQCTMSFMTDLNTSLLWDYDPTPSTLAWWTQSYGYKFLSCGHHRQLCVGGNKRDKWVMKMLWKQRNVKQKSETPSASYLSHCEKDFVTWKYNWLHKHRQVNFSCQEDLLPLVK